MADARAQIALAREVVDDLKRDIRESCRALSVCHALEARTACICPGPGNRKGA